MKNFLIFIATLVLVLPAIGAGTNAFNNVYIPPGGTITAAPGANVNGFGGAGTVTSITAGAGLSGGTITGTGTVSLNLNSANTWTAAQTGTWLGPVNGVTLTTAGSVNQYLNGLGTYSVPAYSGFATNAASAVYANTSGYSTNSGFATNATSSIYATTSNYSTNSGFSTNAGYANTTAYATNSGFATNAGTSIYANTAGYSTNSGFATNAGSSTYAATSGYSTNSAFATNAATSSYATTAGYATNSGFATNATTAGSTGSYTGTLSVANGGTGTTTLTSGAILVGNGTGAITPTATGSGVVAALANTLNGPLALVSLDANGKLDTSGLVQLASATTGTITQLAIPPNSVVILTGDSHLHFPEVGQGSFGQQSATGGIGGDCVAKAMSRLPAFANIPFFDYSVGGSTCVGTTRVLAGTTTPGSGWQNDYFWNGTEYENGAVVGSVAGLSSLPSTHVPSLGSGGICFWIDNHDGLNEIAQSISSSTYLTDMESNFATIRGYGTNVKIIASSAASGNISTLGSLGPYIDAMKGVLGASAGPDALIPLTLAFTDYNNTTFYYTDNLHFTAAGEYQFALMAQGQILGVPYVPNLSWGAGAIQRFGTNLPSSAGATVYVQNQNSTGYDALAFLNNSGTQVMDMGFLNGTTDCFFGTGNTSTPIDINFNTSTLVHMTYAGTAPTFDFATSGEYLYIYNNGTNAQVGMTAAPNFQYELFTASTGSVTIGAQATGMGSFSRWDGFTSSMASLTSFTSSGTGTVTGLLTASAGITDTGTITNTGPIAETGTTTLTGPLNVTGTATLGTGLTGVAYLTSGVVSAATLGSGLSYSTGTLTATGLSNPMTTLGDLIYENATPAAARLAGNTTTAKQFLTQTGTGSASAVPAWGAIAASDIPFLGTSANLTGQNAAVASVATLTPTATSTYQVSPYLNVTAIATDVIEVQVTYSDENSAAQTLTFFPMGLTSALVSTTGPANYPVATIRAGTGSAIVVKTTLTTSIGTIAYDVGANIQRIN